MRKSNKCSKRLNLRSNNRKIAQRLSRCSTLHTSMSYKTLKPSTFWRRCLKTNAIMSGRECWLMIKIFTNVTQISTNCMTFVFSRVALWFLEINGVVIIAENKTLRVFTKYGEKWNNILFVISVGVKND